MRKGGAQWGGGLNSTAKLLKPGSLWRLREPGEPIWPGSGLTLAASAPQDLGTGPALLDPSSPLGQIREPPKVILCPLSSPDVR